MRFAGCFVSNAANQRDEEDSNNLDAPLFIDEYDDAIEVVNDKVSLIPDSQVAQMNSLQFAGRCYEWVLDGTGRDGQ